MFDLDFILQVDLGRSYKKKLFVSRKKKLYRIRPQVHLNRSIKYQGGRFSDIKILLMSKKGVAQKHPPPQPVELKTVFSDTSDFKLQLGKKKTSALS